MDDFGTGNRGRFGVLQWVEPDERKRPAEPTERQQAERSQNREKNTISQELIQSETSHNHVDAARVDAQSRLQIHD